MRLGLSGQYFCKFWQSMVCGVGSWQNGCLYCRLCTPCFIHAETRVLFILL